MDGGALVNTHHRRLRPPTSRGPSGTAPKWFFFLPPNGRQTFFRTLISSTSPATRPDGEPPEITSTLTALGPARRRGRFLPEGYPPRPPPYRVGGTGPNSFTPPTPAPPDREFGSSKKVSDAGEAALPKARRKAKCMNRGPTARRPARLRLVLQEEEKHERDSVKTGRNAALPARFPFVEGGEAAADPRPIGPNTSRAPPDLSRSWRCSHGLFLGRRARICFVFGRRQGAPHRVCRRKCCDVLAVMSGLSPFLAPWPFKTPSEPNESEAPPVLIRRLATPQTAAVSATSAVTP